MKRNLFFSVTLALSGLLLTGCHGKQTPTVEKAIGVETTSVSEASTTQGSSYSGTIEGTNAVALSFSSAGTIQRLNISEGQAVGRGQLLGTVDATTTGNALLAAHATTQQAEDALKQAEDVYRRMKQLHTAGSLPDIQWVDAQTKLSQARALVRQTRAAESIARKGMADTRLIAPFSGYISKKTAEVGQNTAPGVPVATLVTIDRVKVKVSIPEGDISRVRVGGVMCFSVASLNGATFVGRVTEKSVTADPLAHTYDVCALVSNPKHELLPGMVCEAYFQQQGSQQNTLPANLIQIDDDNHPFVWTVVGGKAHKQLLTLGENFGDAVVVAGGLSPESRIICVGQQKVSEGNSVKELGGRN